jgi:hypothetical protein
MKIDLLAPSAMFSVAELSAMALDFEVFRYHDVYAAFWFVESRAIRAKYLLLTTKKKARTKTATQKWVLEGGLLPVKLELVDAR